VVPVPPRGPHSPRCPVDKKLGTFSITAGRQNQRGSAPVLSLDRAEGLSVARGSALDAFRTLIPPERAFWWGVSAIFLFCGNSIRRPERRVLASGWPKAYL
jgi:hypothetical protein